MSSRTKRKIVQRTFEDEFDCRLTPKQQIVRVLKNVGNNLHLVEATDGSRFLVSMPRKFRRNVWIKRNGFVVVEQIEEGVKVKAEIVHILTNNLIKLLIEDNLWPKEFSNMVDNNKYEDDIDIDSAEEDIFVNPNRLRVQRVLNSEKDSKEEDEEDENETTDDEEEDSEEETSDEEKDSGEEQDTEEEETKEQQNNNNKSNGTVILKQ